MSKKALRIKRKLDPIRELLGAIFFTGLAIYFLAREPVVAIVGFGTAFILLVGWWAERKWKKQERADRVVEKL